MVNVEWPVGAADRSISDMAVMPILSSPLTYTAGRMSGTKSIPRWTVKADNAGSAAAIRARKSPGKLGRIDQLQERPFQIGIGDHCACRNPPAVGQCHARGAAALDDDLCDRGIEPHLPATFSDSSGENVGELSGTADGMIAAMKVVTEQRHHFGAGERLRAVADIAGQRGDQLARLRIGDMLCKQLIERLVEPLAPPADALAGTPASPRSSFRARVCRRCRPAANTCPLESRGWQQTAPRIRRRSAGNKRPSSATYSCQSRGTSITRLE